MVKISTRHHWSSVQRSHDCSLSQPCRSSEWTRQPRRTRGISDDFETTTTTATATTTRLSGDAQC